MMRDAEVLILDELSAALDARFEQKIYKNIRAMMKIESMVTITRQTLVAHDGQDCRTRVQTGTQKELTRTRGKHANLFKIQAEQFGFTHTEVANPNSV